MIHRPKILIIDESAIFRTALNDVIRITAPLAHVSEAQNEEQALDLIKHADPDVVFLDIALSEGKGIELIRKIKNLKPSARIAVFTTNDAAEYQEVSMRKGAAYFLSKERLTGPHLFDVIQAALR